MFMKNRFSALDGLRGLAAVSVMLSHLPNNLVLIAFGPIIYSLYGTAFAGSNAVQILFVLTGFLMAYLYPTVRNPILFIKKRYTRIFPMFILASIFFWALSLKLKGDFWFSQILFLLILSFGIRYIWKKIKKASENGINGNTIFWCFIFLQIEVFLFLLFISPQLSPYVSDHSWYYSFLTLLSNITLTTSFTRYVILISNVFWTIPVEIFFYLLYPFFVIPVTAVARRWGWAMGIFLICIATKIIFDLDHEFSIYKNTLLGLNIAHSSGFIAGITVGTMYQQQGRLWKKVEKLAQNTVIGVITFLLLVFTQWANVTLPYAGDKFANNYYFLFASWIIAFAIIGAITPNSIIQKIFAKKIFVFLGVISYSLYLTHEQAIYWTKFILSFFHIPLGVYVCLMIVFAIALSILLAWILYLIVDRLYFEYHQQLPKETIVTTRNKTVSLRESPNFLFLLVSMFVYVIFILYAYLQPYQSSLLIDKYFVGISHTTLFSWYSLSNRPLQIPFTAKNNNLAIIALHLEYTAPETQAKKTDYARVQFHLLDNSHHVIFASSIPASFLSASPEFQFGFPPILHSAGKQYITEFALVPGKEGEKVSINTSDINFTTLSVIAKNKLWPIKLFTNRCLLILTTPSLIIALLLVPIVFSKYILRCLRYVLRKK